MDRMRVVDHESLVRDSKNFAILQTNKEAVKNHENKISLLRKQRHQDEELNTIKHEISEIKSLIAKLIESKI